MTIYQTNVWICDGCGRIETTTERVSAYSDPVVALPDQEWEWVKTLDMRYEEFVCPKCQEGYCE